MSVKKANRKITYHVFNFYKNLGVNVVYKNFDFKKFVDWFNKLPSEKKINNISTTKFTSLDLLEMINERKYEGYEYVVFGMMSTGNQGSRRNLKDSKNNTKRANPKKIEEGEEQENYFLLAFKSPGEVIVIFQNSSLSINSKQLKDYIEKFINKFLSEEEMSKDFNIVEGTIVETEDLMISKLERITKTKVYIDKSILDDELGLSSRTLQVKEDLVLEVTAERNKSIKEFLNDLRQNLTYKTKVDKIWVEGKDNKGNISTFFINDIQKRTFISFEIDPATAALFPSDVKEKLLDLI